MPIEFFSSQGESRVRQTFASPTVYLDHWALRLFSDDASLQDSLVVALKHQNGTLLLSNFTFAEFARSDDPNHSVAAENLIERLLPNIYFTDFALDHLHEQECGEPNNARRFWPSADLPQLKLFCERAPDTSLGFTMQGFISMARTKYTVLEPITKEALEAIRCCIKVMRNDPDYVKAARNARPSIRRTRTFVIMGELMREFILNPTQRISDNDIMDMVHAAMPVNCCDFVLLDGAWEDRVSKLRQRIENAGTAMPIAKCYSRRNNGVSRFLTDLSTFTA